MSKMLKEEQLCSSPLVNNIRDEILATRRRALQSRFLHLRLLIRFKSHFKIQFNINYFFKFLNVSLILQESTRERAVTGIPLSFNSVRVI